MIELHPIFADICRSTEPQEGRYDLTKPWVRGGWVFASDGVIVVRCPLFEPLPPLSIQGPHCLHLFEDAQPERELVKFGELPAEPCASCWDGCPVCWWFGSRVAGNQIIGGVWFSDLYLTLLRKHGIMALEVGADDGTSARFVIEDEDVEGLLAPMRRPAGLRK